MFCPQCRAEFLEGVTRCQSCQVDLVDSIPDEDIFASTEAMARALAGRELEAVVVGHHVALRETQKALTDARIPSVIAGEAGEVEAGLHNRFFLMVEAARLEEARAFFHRRWSQGLEDEGVMIATAADPATTATGVCPACQSPVPDESQECPECGLFLGSSASDE